LTPLGQVNAYLVLYRLFIGSSASSLLLVAVDTSNNLTALVYYGAYLVLFRVIFASIFLCERQAQAGTTHVSSKRAVSLGPQASEETGLVLTHDVAELAGKYVFTTFPLKAYFDHNHGV
jgi:hypothetical protein